MNSDGGMFLWKNRPTLKPTGERYMKEWEGKEPFEFIGEALSKNSYTNPTIEEVYVSCEVETRYRAYHPA